MPNRRYTEQARPAMAIDCEPPVARLEREVLNLYRHGTSTVRWESNATGAVGDQCPVGSLYLDIRKRKTGERATGVVDGKA